MPRRRFTRVPLALATLVVAACSTDGVVSPMAEVERDRTQEAMLARLEASPELRALTSSATPRLVAEAERMIRAEPREWGSFGLQPPIARAGVPPVDASLSPGAIVHVLFKVTLFLYQNGFFADASGDLRLDRAIAIIHPIHYAAVGVASGDADQTIAGLETTIEWYEQRNAEGLIPTDIAQWLIGYANVAIDKLGGSNVRKTMCLTSEQRSCVTAELISVRWILGSLHTRLRHDFSYAFLDGQPAQIEVQARLATGAPSCNLLGSPIETSTDVVGTVLVRQEPTLTANPNVGGFTAIPCVPLGVVRGFRWDGFVVRDADGAVLASCGKASGNPCFEPAD